jgi:hypothetical protein
MEKSCLFNLKPLATPGRLVYKNLIKKKLNLEEFWVNNFNKLIVINKFAMFLVTNLSKN